MCGRWMSRLWKTIKSCPEGVSVETKIDDAYGMRNMAVLMRRRTYRGDLFFSGDVYMYYTPTHWREVEEHGG